MLVILVSESEESALYGDWYSLINEKNALVRRDAELMILYAIIQLSSTCIFFFILYLCLQFQRLATGR